MNQKSLVDDFRRLKRPNMLQIDRGTASVRFSSECPSYHACVFLRSLALHFSPIQKTLLETGKADAPFFSGVANSFDELSRLGPTSCSYNNNAAVWLTLTFAFYEAESVFWNKRMGYSGSGTPDTWSTIYVPPRKSEIENATSIHTAATCSSVPIFSPLNDYCAALRPPKSRGAAAIFDV